jgi:sterol desaturase/sphingolipid hydroxylase (fatty acid hydroxylase superfamily)
MDLASTGEALAAALVEHRAVWLTLASIGGVVLFGVLETLRPKRPGQTQVDRRWLSHIGLLVANVALLQLTIGDPFAEAGDAPGLLPIAALAGDSVLAAIVLGVMATDFLRYAIHRVNHTVPVLWRLHALHHADERPDVTTTFRHHPAEHLLLIATVWAAHLVFGVDVAALVAYGLISSLLSPLQHANLRFPQLLERALAWLFVTNALHLQHHSTDRRDGAANFGIMFTLWDRLLGTYRAPDPGRAETIRYGLDDVPEARCADFKAMVLLPVRM